MKKVIKFSTASCGPCQNYSPIFKKVSSQFDDVEFEEVDCNENPEYARSFGVRGVPCTIFLSEGEVINRIMGLVAESDLKNAVQKM